MSRVSPLSGCNVLAEHEKQLLDKISAMSKDPKSSNFVATAIKAAWFLVFVVVSLTLGLDQRYKLLDSSSLIALIFGIIGTASSLHSVTNASVTSHTVALSRFKYLLKKLQTDESRSIRRAFATHQQSPVGLKVELDFILASYEYLYEEALEYSNGGVQAWAWK